LGVRAEGLVGRRSGARAPARVDRNLFAPSQIEDCHAPISEARHGQRPWGELERDARLGARGAGRGARGAGRGARGAQTGACGHIEARRWEQRGRLRRGEGRLRTGGVAVPEGSQSTAYAKRGLTSWPGAAARGAREVAVENACRVRVLLKLVCTTRASSPPEMSSHLCPGRKQTLAQMLEWQPLTRRSSFRARTSYTSASPASSPAASHPLAPSMRNSEISSRCSDCCHAGARFTKAGSRES
jgi:hypothetical protein